MRKAASELEFERAARLRDQLSSVRKAIERQQMVGDKNEDYDAIGLAEDDLEASIQVFNVRRGRMVGRKGDGAGEGRGALARRRSRPASWRCSTATPRPTTCPRRCSIPVEPEELELYEEFLCHVRGSKVRIRVPQRGNKRAFLETVTKNAEEAFTRHRLKRASDHNARARALTALQDALDLPEAPLRIECYDISHTMGTEIVASMVVMEDGLAKRSDYRRFKIRSLDNQDDFAAMSEVITRRFTNYLRERDEGVQAGQAVLLPAEPRAHRRREGAAVGGGDGAWRNSASEEIPVASLAKRFEEVYRPGEPEPDPHPPGLRGAVPPAGGAGRGPPLRHHLPPRAAGQGHDEVGPRRHPRPRRPAGARGSSRSSVR